MTILKQGSSGIECLRQSSNTSFMDSVILPICPFGNVKWWNLVLNCDSETQMLLNGFENYQKQTWRNRYEILGANGSQSLTIPIEKESGIKTLTSDIRLFSDNHWKKVHWRSIKSAYGSSPFWVYYSDQIEELYHRDFKLLSEFSLASIELIIEELGLEIELATADAESEDSINHSKEFKPSKCNFTSEPYLQVFSDRFEFVQNLSILDLLFNLGPEAEDYLTG